MPRRSPLVLALLAVLGPGCECVAGLDEDVRLGGAGTGGASSSSASAGGAGGDAPSSTAASGGSGGGGGVLDCRKMDVPAYPGGDDPGGDREVVVAVRAIDLNDDVQGEPVGLNLDGACTCPEPSSCIPDDDADEDLLCDAGGGVDAQSRRIFAQLALLTNDQFSSRELSQDADDGRWGLLFRIEGWTGEPTDTRIRFSLYGSPGLPDEAIPTWTGDDAWSIDATSVEPDGTVDQPLYVDENAYVADGVVVASLPQSGITLATSGARLDLKLVAGFLRARLVEEGGQWALRDGILASRLRTADLFQALDGFRDGDEEPLCTDSPLFALARDAICESADIFSDAGTPTSPCDAISVGIGFTAEAARLGAVTEPPELTPGCEGGTEPSRCSCDGC